MPTKLRAELPQPLAHILQFPWRDFKLLAVNGMSAPMGEELRRMRIELHLLSARPILQTFLHQTIPCFPPRTAMGVLVSLRTPLQLVLVRSAFELSHSKNQLGPCKHCRNGHFRELPKFGRLRFWRCFKGYAGRLAVLRD